MLDGPGAEELDHGEIARLIARARYVEVVPSFQCSVNRDQKIARANMDLMLATAMMNVPTNTVASVRQRFGLTLLDVMRAPSRYCERSNE